MKHESSAAPAGSVTLSAEPGRSNPATAGAALFHAYAFGVVGDPKAQPRPRAFARGGSARVYDPGTAEGWKSMLVVAAREAGLQMARLRAPITVEMEFRFRRPESHKRRNGSVKDAAPKHHDQKPDCDNLAKAVLDALTQIGAWDDDARVTRFTVGKTWADAEPHGATVHIGGWR